MKRYLLLLLPALLLVAVVVGCNEESKPRVTRITITPSCGVVPMTVQAYGIASGGNESGSATGGNNNLEFTWNFGDGTSSTSLAYHTYMADTSRTYLVRLTVKDEDGQTATDTVSVAVFADSLILDAASEPAGTVAAGDLVVFDYRAESCSIDPDTDAHYRSLEQTWVFTGPDSDNVYGVSYDRETRMRINTPGVYEAHLTVNFPAWSVKRTTTVSLTVVP